MNLIRSTFILTNVFRRLMRLCMDWLRRRLYVPNVREGMSAL